MPSPVHSRDSETVQSILRIAWFWKSAVRHVAGRPAPTPNPLAASTSMFLDRTKVLALSDICIVAFL
jgi:hypothetical protein